MVMKNYKKRVPYPSQDEEMLITTGEEKIIHVSQRAIIASEEETSLFAPYNFPFFSYFPKQRILLKIYTTLLNSYKILE